MSDPFETERRDIKPPGNVNNLRSRIANLASERGLNVARLNQRILTEALLGVLDRARQLGVITVFLAKGGMALELRFGIRARASGDLDIGLVAGGLPLVDLFDRAIRVGFADFTFERRGEPILLENVRTFRMQVKVLYRGRPFGTLSVDLNEANYETAISFEETGVLAALGLPGPLNVPLLDPYIQIAQKLHGATEPDRADYENLRHRDLLDVLVMRSDDSLKIDLRRLRAITAAEFARRAYNTKWPPIFEMPQRWRDQLARDARDIDFDTSDPDELARRFTNFIAEVEGIDVKRSHEYKFVSIQMNLTGSDPVEAQATAYLNSFINDGWSLSYIGPRPGYVDQFLAVIGRPLIGHNGTLPRLQLRVETVYGGHNDAWLRGNIRNESLSAANRVRVFASGVSEVIKLGTLTSGDGNVDVQIPYENHALRTIRPQWPGVFVQFETDDGTKVEQVGALTSTKPDAAGRLTYSGNGLGPGKVIERFTHRHDPTEEL